MLFLERLALLDKLLMVLQDGLRGKIQVLHRLILVHQIALDQIAVFLAATIHQLEKNGRADGAGHHHEDDGGHIFRLEHPQGDTLVVTMRATSPRQIIPTPIWTHSLPE